MILQMQDNNTVSVMHSTIDTKKTFCARQFTELCELLWKRIRILVELQCAGCDIESSEHSHTCQKLYSDYYLTEDGYLQYFYEKHFDTVFSSVTGSMNIGRITRYKKAQLKCDVFSYIFDRVRNKSLFC